MNNNLFQMHKLDIRLNCAENRELVEHFKDILVDGRPDRTLQAVVAFHLFTYYDCKYRGLPHNNQTIPEQCDDFNTFLYQYDHVYNGANKMERIQYICAQIHGKLQKYDNPLDRQITPQEQAVLDLFAEAGVQDHLIYVLVNKALKKMGDRRVEYFIFIAKARDNNFIQRVLLCEQNLFRAIQEDYIDEFYINKQLYAKQIQWEAEQRSQAQQNFSVFYVCKKCKLKMCRFQPVQTAASDEETRTRVTCYNPDCNNEWIC